MSATRCPEGRASIGAHRRSSQVGRGPVLRYRHWRQLFMPAPLHMNTAAATPSNDNISMHAPDTAIITERLVRSLLDLAAQRRMRYAELSVGQPESRIVLLGRHERDRWTLDMAPHRLRALIAALKTLARLDVSAGSRPQCGNIQIGLDLVDVHCCPQLDGETMSLHLRTAQPWWRHEPLPDLLPLEPAVSALWDEPAR